MKAKLLLINWLFAWIPLSYVGSDPIVAIVVVGWFGLATWLLNRSKREALQEMDKLEKWIDRVLLKKKKNMRTNNITVRKTSVLEGSSHETDKMPSSSQKIVTQIGSYYVYSEYPLSSSSRNYLYRRIISRNCTRQIVHSSSDRTEHPSSSQSHV